MTGALFAERLELRGLDPVDVPAKAALFDMALAAFASLSGGPPAHAWWVPGRLEVFGKHTDYCGGRTLVAAVPRGFAFLASPRTDGDIRVLDARSGDRLTLDAAAAPFDGWRHYVEVVAARLGRNFPGARCGADIVFASDLPRASGMSSSSALVVGVAGALARIWNLETREEWRRNIRSPRDLAAYYACLENGLSFGALAGDAGVGTHGGSEDHAAMLLGTPGSVTAYSFVPMRHLGDARVPDEWRLVIASSGVTAEKTGAAREAYNRLSRAAAVLLELWNAHAPRSPSLAAALASGASAADRLRDLIRRGAPPGWPPEALERRLEHFVVEDASVPGALRAFQETDAAGLDALAAASQEHAERLLGNQTPETIALAHAARAAGAWAACSFGAGFGGSVWALVGRERADGFPETWLARYRAQFPAAHQSTSFIAPPGPPVTEL